jgi:hypothetical protein
MIKKDNQHLLDKLLKIAQRNVTNSQLKPESNQTSNTRSKTNPARKREASRIKRENERFAKKLMSLEPSVSVKKWDEDFERISKYKQQISKPHQLDITASAKMRSSLPESCMKSKTASAEESKSEQPAETL